MTNTAISAKEQITHTITFKNKEHEKFYNDYLLKCRYQDEYHKALVYCLGISEDTRRNVKRIYDFRTGYVQTECLQEGWITSGSARIVRMAFNLYCNSAPSVADYDDIEEQLKESRCYTRRFVLLWICQILLGGNQDPLSGILFLSGLGGEVC